MSCGEEDEQSKGIGALMLLKAIASIGHHSIESECPELESLAGESSRFAQAADPAPQAICFRLAKPGATAPTPF